MSPTAAGHTDPRFIQSLLQSDHAFARVDDAPDPEFYATERMVAHLDATALETVEDVVGSLVTEEGPVILDLMASWDSHLPASLGASKVVGLGLNGPELEANSALTERVLKDVNADPTLPFEKETFDVVLNVVSVEYLTRPVHVFREVGRVLKPGGLFLVVFSNRWFPSKVVRVWEDASEEERIGLVEAYLREAGGFEIGELFVSMGLPRPADDRFHHLGFPSDPVFAVFAENSGGPPDRPPRVLPRDRARIPMDREKVEARRKIVGETLACPHCGQKLSKWKVPDDPCIDWPNEFLYLCFNDACPFVVRGWRFLWEQGFPGASYRYLYNPETGASTTVPIRSLRDLKAGVVPEDT
jgi:SAM-dependent methyltransferase